MDRDAIIAKLNEQRAGLQQLGLVSASLFETTARGDNSPASDIDIAVKPGRHGHPAGWTISAMWMASRSASTGTASRASLHS